MTPLAINWSHVWMVTGLGFCMVILLLVVLIFILKLLGAVVSNAVKAPKAAEPKAAISAPAAQAGYRSGNVNARQIDTHCERVCTNGGYTVWDSHIR